MEDIKDGKEEVLDEVVMEHIKWEVVVMVVIEDVTEEERFERLRMIVNWGWQLSSWQMYGFWGW